MDRIGMRAFRGDRLKEAREAKRYSQSRLAGRIGAHVTSISDWERGVNSPSGRYVAALCAELDVTAEYLYGEDDEEEAAMPGRREADFLEALRPLAKLLEEQTAQ